MGERNEVRSTSETYLMSYVKANTTIADLNVCQVMRAAGQVKTTSILVGGPCSTGEGQDVP